MNGQDTSSLTELSPTWRHAVCIWWALAWRSLIAAVVGMIIGWPIGWVLGFIMGAIGVPLEVIKQVAGVVGGVIGIGISVVPVKMIVGKRFKEFRLVLVANN